MPYKVYSTKYLMKLTKAEIIDILRTAEHNFHVTEEALNNSAEYGRKLAEENKLMKIELETMKKDWS